MGIDVQLRRENGQVVASVDDPRMVLSRASIEGRFAETTLLRYLDPYGDAVFNSAQAGDLLTDIRERAHRHPTEAIGEFLRSLEPLVERLSSEAGVYLWFVGD